jgi:electron transport complex protein RnfA
MIFVNNFILAQFLGLCSFFGVSTKTENAIAMSGAVVFVMTMASAISYPIYKWMMVPLGIEFAQVIILILVIAFLVQLVEFILKKYSQPIYKSLGIFLPLIVCNCAVLGAVLLSIKKDFSFIEFVVAGLTAGIGYGIAIMLMSGIREKLELMKIPKPFRGLPIAFIVAALMSLAFLGFSGMIK